MVLSVERLGVEGSGLLLNWQLSTLDLAVVHAAMSGNGSAEHC